MQGSKHLPPVVSSCKQAKKVPVLFFQLGDAVKKVPSDDDGRFDLNFTRLEASSIELNGWSSMVEATGRTKYGREGLQLRLGNGAGDEHNQAIRITGAPSKWLASHGQPDLWQPTPAACIQIIDQQKAPQACLGPRCCACWPT
jgi:hypothetical protein